MEAPGNHGMIRSGATQRGSVMSRTLDDRRRATAELQRELDECRAERDEALAQQAAIAEILQVINSSPGDLAPVFDAMVEKAIRLCDSALGVLSTFADGYVTHRAYFGPDEAADYFLKRPPTRPGPGTVLDRLLAGENPVQVLDAAAEESYRQGVPARRATVDLAKARSILGIALHKDGKVVGAFSIIRQEVRPFTDKQIALVQNFAAQAVIAIENARLITETREALEQQTATAEVLGVINSSPGDLAPVFDAMLEKALRLCGAAHGSLTTYDGEQFQCV